MADLLPAYLCFSVSVSASKRERWQGVTSAGKRDVKGCGKVQGLERDQISHFSNHGVSSA